MGSVNVNLANGQLGSTPAINDGVAGMVLTGVGEAGYVLGTALLVTGMASLAAAGITLANNPFAYRQIQDFYTEAGDGAPQYVMLVPNSLTVAMMADNTNAAGAKKLLNFAGGKVKLLGVMSDDTVGTAPTVTNGINAAVYTAASNMAVMAGAYFAAEQPFRAIIGATSYNGMASALTVLNATGATNNRTAIFLGDNTPGAAAALGQVLGRLAAISLQHKVSRVRTGPMKNTAAYLASAALATVPTDPATIAAAGFMTWKTFPNVSGYYISGDDTCSATTDDYHYLARGRVIDKAHILAYSTFVQEVDDDVPINTDGTLDAGFCTWLSQQIVNQINTSMTANRQISSVTCFIDPAQNILANSQLAVALKIIPLGYAGTININLSFSNPASH